MLQNVTTNHASSPTMDVLAVPTKAKVKAAASNATNAADTSDTSGTSSASIGSTFLTLLVQELQNQDPTAPVDSTAMVGQMISLNQLDQLVSINQELSGATSNSSGSSSGASSGRSNGPAASVQSAPVVDTTPFTTF